jgi:hypothetical protein
MSTDGGPPKQAVTDIDLAARPQVTVWQRQDGSCTTEDPGR